MKQFIHRYTVTGSGPLPLDMLRYDRAWPRSEADSAAGAPGFGTRLSHVPTTIRLEGLSEPTVGRWDSFGWKVEKEEKVAL